MKNLNVWDYNHSKFSILLAISLLIILPTTSFAQGTVIYDTVYSSSLEGNFLGDSPENPVNIYLPPGYTENPNLAYPVIYLLHGFGHTQGTWMPGGYFSMNIKTILDNLFTEEEIQPMIVVMPNGYNKWHGCWYTNSAVTGNWEDYIVQDLADYIDNNYRTIPDKESRGIAGHSMGGTGAFSLAMKHPDIYSAVFSLSAGFISFKHTIMEPIHKPYLIQAAAETDATQFDSFYWKKQVMIAAAAAFAPDTNSLPFYGSFPVDEDGVLIDSIWTKWLEHDPYTIFGDYKSNLLQLDSIWIECGTSDDLYNSNYYIYQALDSAGIETTWDEYAGGHLNRIPQRIEEKMFPFFSEILDGNYSKSTARVRSMQCYPRFISDTGDSIILNAHLYNPEQHPATVQAIIHGDQYAFTDSLQLYDDGMHNDSLASDNIWGNTKFLAGLQEDIYTIGISSHDMTEDYQYDLSPVPIFTTIGPLKVVDYEITSSDTVPNHGDRLNYKLTLRNEGQTVTATDVTTNLIRLDTCATISGFTDKPYGDIAPGATALHSGSHTIIFSDTLTGCSNPMTTQILVEISSDGFVFWYDTLEIIVSDIEKDDLVLPKSFALSQNYPNPFNPKTIINYELPITNDVDLSIYNLVGQKVATLVSEKQHAGNHRVEWDASGFSSGVYYYKIEAGEFQDVKKMMLLR